MLPLVQQIAQDIVNSRRAVGRLQPEEEQLDRERRSLDWPMRNRRYEIKEELLKPEKGLEAAPAELRNLALVLLNKAEGRIGSPTMVNNRRAYFSWRLGEEALQT